MDIYYKRFENMRDVCVRRKYICTTTYLRTWTISIILICSRGHSINWTPAPAHLDDGPLGRISLCGMPLRAHLKLADSIHLFDEALLGAVSVREAA